MVLFFSILLGAILGSFASALIPRLRAGADFVQSRSECPSCHHTLSALDLFPMLSFICLRGRCRYCRAPIAGYHFLLELAMASIFGLIGVFFVDINLLLALDISHIVMITYLMSAAFVTVVFSAYDLLYMEIPDQVLIPFLLLAFVLLWALHLSGWELGYMRSFENVSLNSPLIQGMLGLLPIFGFFMALVLVSKGRWLWGGDLRIALFMGLVGGAQIAWLGLFGAYISGSIIGIGLLLSGHGRKTMIPFGPFLAIGLWWALFLHAPILTWYYSFLN